MRVARPRRAARSRARRLAARCASRAASGARQTRRRRACTRCRRRGTRSTSSKVRRRTPAPRCRPSRPSCRVPPRSDLGAAVAVDVADRDAHAAALLRRRTRGSGRARAPSTPLNTATSGAAPLPGPTTTSAVPSPFTSPAATKTPFLNAPSYARNAFWKRGSAPETNGAPRSVEDAHLGRATLAGGRHDLDVAVEVEVGGRDLDAALEVGLEGGKEGERGAARRRRRRRRRGRGRPGAAITSLCPSRVDVAGRDGDAALEAGLERGDGPRSAPVRPVDQTRISAPAPLPGAATRSGTPSPVRSPSATRTPRRIRPSNARNGSRRSTPVSPSSRRTRGSLPASAPTAITVRGASASPPIARFPAPIDPTSVAMPVARLTE